MRRQNKMLMILYALLLTAAVFSSVLFIAAKEKHDCIGDDCSICCQIQSCEMLLKNMMTSEGEVFLAAVMLSAACMLVFCNSKPIFHITLVTLKVKLSN